MDDPEKSVMPHFDEDKRGELVVPHRPTLVIWRCRRCGCDENLPVTNPLVTVREAVERGHVLRMHDCADRAQGVADLVGSGPGTGLALHTSDVA